VAVLALVNAFAFVHGYDFTVDTNKIMLDLDAVNLDATVFGSGGWKTSAPLGGVRSSKFDMAGFWQSAAAAAPDPEAFADLGVMDRVHTCGDDQVETSIAYALHAGKVNYQLLGQHGELAPFALSSVGSNAVGTVRGQLAKAKGNVSGTGQLGSVLQLGAPTATQFVTATLHVFSAGTTITVQVQSDDNAGMSSPTTRATIGPVTAVGGTLVRVAGPFAGETHWRLNVSAVTGAFQVAGMIAVDH
jgi:hypothetical protein